MAKLRALLLISSLSAVALAPACSRSSRGATEPEKALHRADISLAEAISAVHFRGPQGTVVRAQFQLAPTDASVYAVESMFADELLKVLIDADDGEVLSIERGQPKLPDDRVAALLISRADVSMPEAITAAEDQTDGIAFEAKLDEEHYVIGLLTEAGPIELTVSRHDGAILTLNNTGSE